MTDRSTPSAMSSSPEAIAAYLAHLKETTSKAHAASPDEDVIDQFLENEAKLSDASSSPTKSGLTKKRLKSPLKNLTITNKLLQYEKKYVRGEMKKIIHKSSVESVPEESDQGSTADRSQCSDTSTLDSQLEKWLEESSLSDGSPNASRMPRVRKSGLENVLSAENLLLQNSTYSPPVEGQFFNKNLVSASNRRQAFGASRGGSGGQASTEMTSQSLPNERLDLRRGPPEGDGTISTTPERSTGSLLRKTSKSSIFKSSSLLDDSSTPEERLSKKISRRDSYVCRDGVELVSASSSSDATIHTDSEISDEIDEHSSTVRTLSHETQSNSVEKLVVASLVMPTAQKKIDVCVAQTNSPRVSPDHDKNCCKTVGSTGIRNSSPGYDISVLNSTNYSTTFESDSSGETRSKMKRARKQKAVTNDELIRNDQPYESSVCNTKSKSSSTYNRMTSSTSISLETTSASGTSCRYARADHERRSKKHGHRSHSHGNRCSHCGRTMRHGHTKTKYRRRESCTSDYSSSSSSDSMVTYRRRARSCRKCRRRKRKECGNCKRLQDLLFWSTGIERLWSSDFHHQLPARFGNVATQGSFARKERVEDAMRETISLGQKFLASQRSMYGAYCSTLQSTHHYTTVHQIKEALLSAATSES